MKNYRSLKTVALTGIDSFVDRSGSSPVTVDSPAAEIFTDFAHTTPLVIDSNATVDEALLMMKRAHVHSKFVLGPDGKVQGILTSLDLKNRPLRAAAAMGINRSDIVAKDIMTPLSRIHALDYSTLPTATIGDIITTLQHLGERHIIVADLAESSIRGIISATDIARKLHIAVDITSRATSFADIYKVLSKT